MNEKISNIKQKNKIHNFVMTDENCVKRYFSVLTIYVINKKIS